MGTKLGWRLLDPIGGMVLSAYIIIEWVKTLLQNFANREFSHTEILNPAAR
jgi:divalent metal cation (Fe/Co/Zn/Cd) transporter